MPARTLRQVEAGSGPFTPGQEWRPLCLECQWLGEPLPDEDACNQLAYEHNVAHHDGAGVTPVVADILGAEERMYRFSRRHFYWASALAILGCLAVVFISVTMGPSGLRGMANGGSLALAMCNAYFAGLWGERMQASADRIEILRARHGA
jgi:hypothetical protein